MTNQEMYLKICLKRTLKFSIMVLIAALFFLTIPAQLFALTSKVTLTEGGDPAFREILAQRLTRIVNCLEFRDWSKVTDCCTPEGLTSLKELADSTGCRNLEPLYETRLLNLPDGNFEVRDIKVLVKMQDTEGNPTQCLVFEANPAGLVFDVRFAMEKERYLEIISQGEKLQDFVYRQPIVQFLELFRTAHNRKDLPFIDKVYSEGALIIVGKVLQEKPNSPDYLENSILSKGQIQFIRLSKREYIDRLRTVFAANAFVKVNFDSIDVKRSPDNPNIYGVMLKQNWNSSVYSDEGYLFLMLDFSDVKNPLIHVRSWQPERFPDGSVFNLGDIILVPGARK